MSEKKANTPKDEPAPKKSRVDEVHGGEVVEAIAPEDLESFNDADCKHAILVRDASETEFNAFMCASPNCNVVVLYDKL